MLDKRTEMMLEVANTLTAEDLDEIRASAPVQVMEEPTKEVAVECETPHHDEASLIPEPSPSPCSGMTQGERERMRSRESKISTACVGQQREKHEWWSIGTELIGRIGPEEFTSTVVRNSRVKSGRSILITSGASQSTMCITPTRAAIEATEAYRKANDLGRGGGVTNGWTFWQPKQ